MSPQQQPDPDGSQPVTRTQTATKKRRFEVLIDEGLCRSCQVCIAFCPTDVLSSRYPLRKAEVIDIEACIGCRLCELLCPDWAVAMHELPATNNGGTAA